jgi:hypothetical protein
MRRLIAALTILLCAAAPQPAPPDQPPPDPAPAWPNAWVQRGTASIAALDKLSARPTALAIRAGDSAPFRTLTIAVRSCVVRPPDRPADAAAWLDVTDSRPGSPEFHGWMLAGEPGLAILQSPTYDVRLLGCR